jgi:hypothetical protein
MATDDIDADMLMKKAKENSVEAQALAKQMASICHGQHSSIMGPAITFLCGLFVEQVEREHPGDGEKAKHLFLSGMDTMLDHAISMVRAERDKHNSTKH